MVSNILTFTTSFFTITMIFSAIPLIIVFSLCYAATRHEDMRLILSHAVRFGGLLTFFMVLIIVIMELLYRYIH